MEVGCWSTSLILGCRNSTSWSSLRAYLKSAATIQTPVLTMLSLTFSQVALTFINGTGCGWFVTTVTLAIVTCMKYNQYIWNFGSWLYSFLHLTDYRDTYVFLLIFNICQHSSLTRHEVAPLNDLLSVFWQLYNYPKVSVVPTPETLRIFIVPQIYNSQLNCSVTCNCMSLKVCDLFFYCHGHVLYLCSLLLSLHV